MVQWIVELFGINDPQYIHYAYYGALIMIPFCCLLAWDGICCIFRSFTRFR